MNVEHINAFYQATKNVLKLMTNVDVRMGQPKAVEGMVSSKEANVMLGVIGDLEGSVLFAFPKDMTLDLVEIMSGMKVEEIGSFVSSALGEVANIIGGNAVTILAESGKICDIVPPQIFIGDYKSISSLGNKSISLPLLTDIGDFEINIFLKDKK